MIVQKVAKLTLHTSKQTLLPTITSYTNAFNFATQIAYNYKNLDANTLHRETYATMRTSLPAQLAVSARCKAIEAIKALRTKQKEENWKAKYDNREPKLYRCPTSRQQSIRYDARSYNIWFDRNQVSLLTTTGRLKINFTVPEYFKQYLSWKRCSADLVIKGEHVFLHVVFEKDIPEPAETGIVIGVDRGINNPAVLSSGTFYGGKHVQVVKKRYQRLRSILQSKGHSGKRHFRLLEHKENRFVTDVNHCISKQIVSHLQPGDVLVLEDLTHIRDKKTKSKEKIKVKRKKVNSWSFFQLEFFLNYKATFKGIKVVYVNPCYTSQECHRCGHISENNRVTQSLFSCEQCGYVVHADYNGSQVIGKRYLEARSLEACLPQAIGCVGGAVVNQSDAPLTKVEQAPGL